MKKTMRGVGERVAVLLSGVLLGAAGLRAESYRWKNGYNPGQTNAWNSAAEWVPNTGFPNAVGDAAALTNNFYGGQMFNLNQEITVGALTLGDNAYGTPLTIAAGTGGSLVFDATSGDATLTRIGPSPSAGAPVDIIQVPVTLNDTLQVYVTNSTGLLMTNVIDGAGGLVKSGDGVLTLGKSGNTYQGKTVVQGGVLRISPGSGVDTALGAVPASAVEDHLTLDGGTLELPNPTSGTPYLTNALNRGITLGANGGTFKSGDKQGFWLNAKITGPGGLTVNNGSTTAGYRFVLNNPSNDFAGSVTVLTGGMLQTGINEVIPNTASVELKGTAILMTYGLSETINGLTTEPGSEYRVSGGTLVVGANNGGGTVSGSITDWNTSGGKIVKTGSGEWLLNSTNISITGTTTVMGGFLGGTGTIVRSSVIVTNDAGLSAGGTGAIGTFTVNNNVTFREGTRLNYDYNPTTNDLLVVNGTLTLPAALTVNMTALGGAGLKSPLVLVRYNALSAPGSFSGWTFSFAGTGKYVARDDAAQSQIVADYQPPGTLIRFL